MCKNKDTEYRSDMNSYWLLLKHKCLFKIKVMIDVFTCDKICTHIYLSKIKLFVFVIYI